MDELIIKYITGEADAAEQAQLQSWLKETAAHRTRYQHYLAIWENSKSSSHPSDPDIEQAWQRFDAQRNPQNGATMPGKAIRFRKWTSIAAAVTLLVTLSLGWVFFKNDRVAFETIAQSASYTLPDQSVVTLNSQSRIWYRTSFNKKARAVRLEGEAFFDVTPNRDKPFKVSINDIEVEVLGTSFNIRSDKHRTEIVVESGAVVVNRNGVTYSLQPQDKLVFDKEKQEGQLSRVNSQLYQYYRTNMFVCERTAISELVESLSQAYNVRIIIRDPELAHKLITSKFPKTPTVEPILTTVAETINARLEQEGEDYILK